MSPLALLLRILLSLSLILDGTGTAVAATHMLTQHVAQSAPSPVRVNIKVAVAAPCHQHESKASSAKTLPVAMADMGTRAVKSSHGSTDCCKTGHCGCACLQATPAAMVALSLPGPVLDHVATASPMKPGHASPALPHLIRPPIG